MDAGIHAPIFVKIDDYKEIRSTIDTIKAKLGEARSMLVKAEDLRKRENEELTQWDAALVEVEQKVSKIDENLVEPEHI